MSNQRELIPEIDAKKSFYGKAKVIEVGGHKMLISYSTNVASIIRHRDGKERAYIYDDNISNATLSHIKEFLRQNGFKADTKQQILKDYHLKGD